METFVVNKKQKVKTKEELLKLSKEELVNQILRLEAHSNQLKNIINKINFTSSNNVQTKAKKGRIFDFSKHPHRHILLHISYFGWSYQGLATQEDTAQTIENYLFDALTTSCLIESRENCSYNRCGRTDKGVSSFGQVISIKVRSKFPEDEQNIPENLSKEIEYCKLLNRILPEEIRVIAWLPIPKEKPEFSARFDCNMRKYRYYFPKSKLNIENMRKACKYLIGNHDFRNFCKMDVGNGVTVFHRDIVNVEINRFDDNPIESAYTMYYFLIEGNAFLWHQIRCIFSLLLLIGDNYEKPEVILELLDVDNNPRKPQYAMALNIPLNLFECKYDIASDWIHDVSELEIVIKNCQKLWTLHSVKTTMIRDVLNSLELVYKNKTNLTIQSQSLCLTEGVISKIYKPLLKRDTCSSLEERIEHFEKKRRIVKKNVDESTT